MAITESISISLPGNLLLQARALADQQSGGLDEVVSIALQREIQRRENFKTMLREGNAWGLAMGITSEEDVERIANGEMELEQLRRSA